VNLAMLFRVTSAQLGEYPSLATPLSRVRRKAEPSKVKAYGIPTFWREARKALSDCVGIGIPIYKDATR
jgi:hypothetical protein